jgi:hypothetical protein
MMEDDLWCYYSDLPSVMSYEEPKKIYLSNMKYLITESQFDKVIFKYLDNQDFIKIERSDSVYFANSESDEDAQIRFDKEDEWCYIHIELIDEISSFFSMGQSDSKQVIGRWLENTLQMKVTNTSRNSFYAFPVLRIPSK